MAGTKLDSRNDIYRGDLFVFVGGQPIAFASNATLEVTTEEIDISNKMLGDWGRVITRQEELYSVIRIIDNS